MPTSPRSRVGRRGRCVWATGKGAMGTDATGRTLCPFTQRRRSARCSVHS